MRNAGTLEKPRNLVHSCNTDKCSHQTAPLGGTREGGRGLVPDWGPMKMAPRIPN